MKVSVKVLKNTPGKTIKMVTEKNCLRCDKKTKETLTEMIKGSAVSMTPKEIVVSFVTYFINISAGGTNFRYLLQPSIKKVCDV
jgi:hypothetical protein